MQKLVGDLNKMVSLYSFEGLFEPSDIVEIEAGLFLIVEDEGASPLFLSRINSEDRAELTPPQKLLGAKLKADDIEGVTIGKNSEIYLISSHSKGKKSKGNKKRRQLIRLTMEQDRVVEKEYSTPLFDHLTTYLQNSLELSDNDIEKLNIEGLSFDNVRQTLFLGLRSPLKDRKSILVNLLNPYDIFSKDVVPLFSGDVILLDLGGAGIRAMTYSASLKSYFFANELETKKNKYKPALWSLDESMKEQPKRLRLPILKGYENIEGLASFQSAGADYLILVCDDGNRKKKKGAHYIILSYDSLTL